MDYRITDAIAKYDMLSFHDDIDKRSGRNKLMVPCRIQNWTECDRCVGRGGYDMLVLFESLLKSPNVTMVTGDVCNSAVERKELQP